jgi:hypothetical protein
MGRASPTEAVLTVYLASLDCPPISEDQLVGMVKEKFGCNEAVVRKAIGILVDSKRTWIRVREGDLLRPKTLKELDNDTSLGSFPIKIDPTKRPAALNYVYFGLATVIGICAMLQYLTPIFLFLPVILVSSGVLIALAVLEKSFF